MTKTTSVAKVQKYIDKIINHLEPNRNFINMHMTAWFCDNSYEKHVPKDIREEVKTIDDVHSAIKLFFNPSTSSPDLIQKHQNLYNFIHHEKSFYLENFEDKLYLTADEMMNEFHALNIPVKNGLNLNVREFMKEKKNHEVKIASKIIGTLARDHLVVDIGDGLGYLSTRLALEFNIKTLGIEGNPNNVTEAKKRNEKLTKLWKHLIKKDGERNDTDVTRLEPQVNSNNYRTIASFIYNDTDLNALIDEAYPEEKDSNVCLIGLHACGNLSSNILKHFVNNDRIRLVWNIPCCYNLIYEEFSTDIFNNEARKEMHPNDFGFPLSDYLRKKNFKIERNARMLATQNYDKILIEQSQPDQSLFYRAIFEKLLKERFRQGQEHQVFALGKIRKVENVEQYLIKACAKLKLTYDLTSEEIEQLEMDHQLDREKIKLHYYIRLMLAKTIEGLIHLDRKLYLLENGIKNVYLVKCFSELSPRNIALIGIKDKH